MAWESFQGMSMNEFLKCHVGVQLNNEQLAMVKMYEELNCIPPSKWVYSVPPDDASDEEKRIQDTIKKIMKNMFSDK